MALSASLMTQWSVLCMVRGLVSSVDVDIGGAEVGFGVGKNIGCTSINSGINTISISESSRSARCSLYIYFRQINFVRFIIVCSIFCSCIEFSVSDFKIIFAGNNIKILRSVKVFCILGKVSFVFILGFLHSLGLVSLVDYGGQRSGSEHPRG